MNFEAVGLCESGMAYVTIIGFFTSVYPQMAFELGRVSTCICAVRALIRTFTCVTANMTF